MRKFLFFVAAFILLVGCTKTPQHNQDALRPNILFIAVDDLRPDLGCYGNKVVHSPNMDKLAETGAVFTHHYAQVPTCGASRYSMLTGMLPKTRGYLSNEACREFIAEQQPQKMVDFGQGGDGRTPAGVADALFDGNGR